ncbi:MAG: bifunctional phosphoribosylaminoimidazolecarboxamide formyltransferase/IMP cyclohydrolase PurH [Gammaproteobacteria bacterium]|nr:MAG: bifunctional phosphoribosylaminoimidazolecarboxamide formyltransferase/IMP cyclohydrolase PurH [Gammaproteobacteria bacterium]
MNAQPHPIRRALLSVSDKRGLVELARRLQDFGVELLSTGGTARLLREAGLAVREVSDYTGFPELMGGRLKTLHPRIHGGILARRGQDEEAMAAHGILPIDLVVVNLYPFEETAAREGSTLEEAVEQIDIGGPAMVRAAAKNHAAVTVVVDPADYETVLHAMGQHQGAVPLPLRRHLAAKAFAHTARYDGAIAAYLSAREPEAPVPFPAILTLQASGGRGLRYGENPHQQAAFYPDPGAPPGSLGAARLLQGKPLSYNNLMDADAALALARLLAEAPACVIVKHANPCGAAQAEGLLEAYRRAYRTDPTSAFGGIIAFTRPVDGATARAVVEGQFVEVVVAPDFAPEARAAFAAKPRVRLLATGPWEAAPARGGPWELRRIHGGLLVQTPDEAPARPAQLRVVTRRQPSPEELEDLLFAWRVARLVKSNAIVYAAGRATLGVGAGQMSRVDSARLAALKAEEAGLALEGAVMASDAFFPFRDGIDQAAQRGIRAVIQPGGSLRDEEVIAAADEHGMAMVLTGVRHFRH